MKEFDRILVRATNWLGDAVMSLAAFHALRARYPAARISILARPWVADLYEREPFCDELIPYEAPPGFSGLGKKWKLARELAERKFDAAILLPNAFEAAALVCSAGIPVRIGYARDGRGWLLTHAVEVPEEFHHLTKARKIRVDANGNPRARQEIPRKAAVRHQRFYYLELLRRSGLIDGYPADAESQLSGAGAAAEEGRRLFTDGGFPSAVIGMSPGAAFGSAKRWLPERFRDTGILLARKWGAAVAVFGSPEEAALCEEISKGISAAGVMAASLAGRTSLREFIDRAAACFVYVTNDSGAMHVASALGVPTVAIFGATDAVATGPARSPFRIVQQKVECSPCQLRECPIDHRCMERVTVERVAAAAEELVK